MPLVEIMILRDLMDNRKEQLLELLRKVQNLWMKKVML
jgi:hypothetical protein